jgi:hypothetical protein
MPIHRARGDLWKGAVVVGLDVVVVVTLEAGRRWGTARKRAGRSPSGLTTTHCHAAARYGRKR